MPTTCWYHAAAVCATLRVDAEQLEVQPPHDNSEPELHPFTSPLKTQPYPKGDEGSNPAEKANVPKHRGHAFVTRQPSPLLHLLTTRSPLGGLELDFEEGLIWVCE